MSIHAFKSNGTATRSAFCISSLIAIVTALATFSARAATTITWPSNQIGGSEENPWDIADQANWGYKTVGGTYNIKFVVDTPTVFTNSIGMADKIGNWFYPEGGIMTFLGDIWFKDAFQSKEDTTIIKKGNWTFSNQLRIGWSSGKTTVLTNECGNLTAGGVIYLCEANCAAKVVKKNDDWTAAGLQIGYKAGANAEFFNLGGDLTLGGDLYVGYNGQGVLTIEGGTVEVNSSSSTAVRNDSSIYLNGGTLMTKCILPRNNGGTLIFNGGTLKANEVDANGLIKSGVTVTVNAGGGVIDSCNFAISIGATLGGTGGLTLKGGNTITLHAVPAYTGATTIELGTTLVIPSAIEGSSLTVIVPAGAVKGVYEVVRISGEGMFADDTANEITCADENARFVFNADKTAIVCVYGYGTDENAYIGGNGGNLSVEGNWLSGNVPTSGNVTFEFGTATTVAVGDTFRADTITIPDTSAVMTIGAGDLHLNTLTNASRLAIASGASLMVEGNLVSTQGGVVLCSNEGTVLVKGDVDFQSKGGGNKTYYQYEVVTDTTTPIMAGGLAYNGPNDYLTVYLGKNTDSSRAGQWVVGAKGLHYKSSRNIWHTGFMMGQGVTTLYSSSDWTLASSGRNNSTRDLGNYYNTSADIENSSLIFDTNNYTNNTVSHTITINGRLISSATEDPAVTIKGAGTVVINTSEGVGREGYKKTSIGTTLAVTDTATLQVNKGKSIIGDGKISLAAGTTLALESTASTFMEADIIPVTLPETGKATIKIDGTRLRGDVDFSICTLTNLPEGYNVADHVTVIGTAINGRKCTVKTVEVTENEKTVTKLVANISPAGLILTFK